MQSTSEPGQVIAFYSFKGGTGRSMALANIGCTLAQMQALSKPILLIDWDLEAPGLHRYFRKHLFQAFRGSEQVQEESPGLIDLFIELRDRTEHIEATEPQEIESAIKMLAEFRVEDYIVKTDIPRLHLLKAGRFDKGYAERISRFDWPALYRKSPYLLKAFAGRLAKDYRYVLIDSRTGLTDTSSICTMLLPEILVTVFTPNRQSLLGVIDLIMDAGRYRLQSEDVRPLVIYPLPSRIEASEPALRQQWRHGDEKAGIEGFQGLFEKAFAEIYALEACNLTGYFDDVQIQHAPRYAYGEELAVLIEESRDRFSLTRSFQRFATRLVEGQPPWTTSESSLSMAEDAGLDDDLTISAGEAASKRREAAAYLLRIEEPTNRLKRYLALYIIAGLGFALLLIAVFTAALIPEYSSKVISIRGLAVLGLLGLAAKEFLSRRKGHLESSIAIIDEQIDDFKNERPPYETAEALTRLKERLDPIVRPPGLLSSRRNRRNGKIYISYLRTDGPYVGRLYDSLAAHFGEDRVFMDVDSIPIGANFADALRAMVESSSVMLVVVGPSWSTVIKERGSRGVRTFVETEISLALSRNMLVIPVFVGNSAFPDPSDVSETIRPLLNLQAIVINDTRWRADVVRLTDELDRVVGDTGH
jgi:MinD-like ATPase involved in chromosome partitioning or flagellar assembly